MSLIWVILAVILSVLEVVMGFPITCFLVAICALLTAFIGTYIIDLSESFLMQCILFLSLIPVLFIALLKPLKNIILKSKANYSNIIEQVGVVDSQPLKKNVIGQIKWSGTIAKAMLDDDCELDELAVGTTVSIVEIKSNIFIVGEKK